MDARVWNFQYWLNVTDPEALRVLLEGFLKDAGFQVLRFVEHQFPNGGWTGIWLLAESHLAAHTFPEKGQTYIELSSCVKGKFDMFVQEFLFTNG